MTAYTNMGVTTLGQLGARLHLGRHFGLRAEGAYQWFSDGDDTAIQFSAGAFARF